MINPIKLGIMAVTLCYLIGSIPEAWLIARWQTGQDLRDLGSGNLGVTNTALNVARWAGLLVFMTEAVKGISTVLLVRALGGSEQLVALGVLAVVVGTRWSIWLGGAGGRGNTAGVAALFVIDWRIPIIYFLIWLVIRLISRSSFLATRICLILWPAIFWFVTGEWWYAIFGAGLSLIYLQAQQPDTDDHEMIKERWPSLLAFLFSPPRK